MLAGIISDFGSPTGAVPFGGRGEFDGVMTGAFRAPRVEGLFTGEDLRAFDTLWGDGSAQIVVENRYVNVKDGVVRARRFGDPRRRPVLARLSARGSRRGDQRADPRRAARSRQPAARVRHRRVPGVRPAVRRVPPDRRLRAAGRLRRDDDRRRRRLRRARSRRRRRALRFDGTGVRLDNLSSRRTPARSPAPRTSAGTRPIRSTPTAGAFRSSGSRSSRSRARRCRASPSSPRPAAAPSTSPRNDFRFRVDDLFVGEEGVGAVNGTLALRGAELSGVDRRGVAAHGADRHRPHRADAAGRRGADVPLPRHVARSVRPAVRAEAVAVHDRRRQRLDPRRRRARRLRSPASSTAPSTRSRCGCSTTA